VRVHPELLAKQKLPPERVTKQIWEERFEDICNFEKYLARNGVVVRKFFLHVSKREQLKRFLSRLDEPGKSRCCGATLASILDETKLRRVLAKMLDENEF
jgi:polyphosphate kinase 2 (PPK2 family)